jgi:hypothetical protein
MTVVGSKAALRAPTSNFRFAPDSGLKSDIAPCPKTFTLPDSLTRSKQHHESTMNAHD